MHHVFDIWMKQNYPTVPFERYVDDAIVHCKTQKQAEFMRVMIKERLAKYKLKLHPDKTQIVYCKDGNRKNMFPTQSFDYLGYTFRPRKAKSKIGKYFVAFLPAISNKVKKKITTTIRSWKILRKTHITLEEISKKVNPIVRERSKKCVKPHLGTFKKVCQAAFLVQLNFQSIWKENIKLRNS